MKKLNFLILFFCLFSSPLLASTAPWPAQTARSWYENQPWLVGANYIPAYAINQLEMWQAESFSPKTIDGELAIAEHIGLNSMRVFLHDLLWAQDSAGFSQRIDLFLQIASRHHIRPIFVLFDSCWDPRPHLGKQKNPVAGVHNSGWVQSPGVNALLDPTQLPRLQSYVTGIVGRFSRDPRILGWDVWNEPENLNLGSYNDTNAKLLAVQTMLPKVFDWARAGGPMQPLTSPLWTGDWSNDVNLSVVQRIQISLSDVISFHSYDPAEVFSTKASSLRRFGRPIWCSEYMARTIGSTVQAILPFAKINRIAAFNWGFVAGKTQTYYPWDSWQHPYPSPPKVWFHDLFYPNGLPFSLAEIQSIEQLTLGFQYPPSLAQ